MFKIHCQPFIVILFFFLDTSDNCTCKYAVKLKTQRFLYVLLKISGDRFGKWFYAWHVFLLPCVSHTIRYVQTEISLVLMLSRKQTNVSPILPPNWKWCGIFHIFWFKVHHHVSTCRWKGLSTQCLMPIVTTLPARYLVQHRNLFCDNVFHGCIRWL